MIVVLLLSLPFGLMLGSWLNFILSHPALRVDVAVLLVPCFHRPPLMNKFFPPVSPASGPLDWDPLNLFSVIIAKEFSPFSLSFPTPLPKHFPAGPKKSYMFPSPCTLSKRGVARPDFFRTLFSPSFDSRPRVAAPPFSLLIFFLLTS